MDLNVNITARTLLVGRAALTPLSPGRVHQNDRFTVSVWLCSETGEANDPLAVGEIPAEFTRIAVAARSADDLEEDDLLFSATSFTAEGTGATLHYEAELNLNTAALAAKFPEENTTLKTIDALLDIELSNEAGTRRLTVVSQWPIQIKRDIYRGSEGVPVDGDPVYPAPDAIALNAPTDGSYKIEGGIFMLWNSTQLKYQPVSITGADGAETITILADPA